MTNQERRLDESARLVERAQHLVPAWTQTLSKNPTQWVQGVAPAYVARASGAHVWDVDGNRYIDFPMALGPVILGHAHPAVNDAIAAQLRDGITYTLPHPVELDVAQRIVDRVPGAERVRFGKSGSDAMSAAVRLARAITGRDLVVVAGYHGWHDWYIASTSRNRGVPAAVRDLTETFTYNDLESLDRVLDTRGSEVAAVILEPSGAARPAPGFLEGVAEHTRRAGALLVFDEIITGFRLAPGGAQEKYGVQADLVAFGKALGNGMPVSALTGAAEHMDVLAEVFFSGTHGGEALSLAAARATIDAMTPEAFKSLWEKGERLRTAVDRAIVAHGLGSVVTLDGEAPRTVMQFVEPAGAEGLPARSLVQQEMAKSGVLFNGSNFICVAHSDEDLEQAAVAYGHALGRLADGLTDGLDGVLALLEGPAVQPAFRPVA